MNQENNETRTGRVHLYVKRLVFGTAIILLGLVMSGFIYQRIAAGIDASRFPPYGDLVEVGEHRLHIHCIGEGSPTIVVDNGGGNWSITWLTLQEQLADITRTCVYDRAGLGWSEPGPLPRTSERMVEELHTLLQNEDISPPYVLVGHSLGGYNARIYADRYPSQVAGVALIESGHEEQWSRLPAEVGELLDEQIGIAKIGRILAHVGIVRLFMAPERPELSPEYRRAHTAAMVTPKTLSAIIHEVESARISARQTAETKSLGDLPLVVVTARHSNNAFVDLPTNVNVPFEEADRIWFALQEELATLSSNSQHFISETGTHDINFDDPDLVVEALEQLLLMIEGQNSQ